MCPVGDGVGDGAGGFVRLASSLHWKEGRYVGDLPEKRSGCLELGSLKMFLRGSLFSSR